LTAVTILIIYFYYPETKGKSLEELAELFGDTVVVHLTDVSEEERRKLDVEIENEKAQMEHVEHVGVEKS